MTIGSEIKNLRQLKSLNQKQFASMICVTPSYLSLIEKDKVIPSMKLLKVISKKLDISMYYMIFKSIDEKDIPNKESYKHLKSILDTIINELFLK